MKATTYLAGKPAELPAGPAGPVAPVAPVAPAGPCGPAAPLIGLNADTICEPNWLGFHSVELFTAPRFSKLVLSDRSTALCAHADDTLAANNASITPFFKPLIIFTLHPLIAAAFFSRLFWRATVPLLPFHHQNIGLFFSVSCCDANTSRLNNSKILSFCFKVNAQYLSLVAISGIFGTNGQGQTLVF